jgi:GntR family transcriptional regulator
VTRSHLIAVNPDDPRPLYVQIVDEVRRGILGGTLGPESPLPSVRELARDLRVNPNTVQQAYRELEREGEIYVRRGQGSFVAPGAGPLKEELRDRVAGDLADRCLREAARAGLTAEELVEAIRAAVSAAATRVEVSAPAAAPAPTSTSTSTVSSTPTSAGPRLPDHEDSR